MDKVIDHASVIEFLLEKLGFVKIYQKTVNAEIKTKSGLLGGFQRLNLNVVLCIRF